MSSIDTTVGKVDQVQVRPTGSAGLVFDVDFSSKSVSDVLSQHGCIFRFEILSWNAETEKGRVRLVPDNGMVKVLLPLERAMDQVLVMGNTEGEPVGRRVQ